MRSTILIVAAGLALGGCASQSDQASPPPPPESTLPTGAEPVQLTPAEFTTAIDNPYWPMRPGMRWVYREVAGDGTAQRVVVRVTGRVKRIMGIEARVVRDTVTEGGTIVEDTVGERVEVPFGSYTGVLMTKDFTPLDPKMLEHKFYARGVGPVLVLAVSGGSDREELLRFTR